MNLHEVLKAGRSGFVYTALGISFALLVGLALGKLLRVRGNSSFLITAGTAICGGSAIAAIGPILHADDEEMAVSLGTVFILNSVALLIFPPIGGALHLSQIAIRPLGRACDSRHKFSSRRCGQIRPAGSGHRHDSKTGPCALDCSSCARHGRDHASQIQRRIESSQ